MSRASQASISPEPTFFDSAVEALGGLSIALAAAACSGIAQARGSPIAWATLLMCGVVITPFACFAGLVMLCGFLACLPIVSIGLACAWTPVLTRHACSLASKAAAWTASTAMEVAEFAERNPIVLLGAALMALPLLPVLAVGTLLAGAGYLLFAPITVPATLFLLYRWRPPLPTAAEEVEVAAAHDSAFDAADEVGADVPASIPPRHRHHHDASPLRHRASTAAAVVARAAATAERLFEASPLRVEPPSHAHRPPSRGPPTPKAAPAYQTAPPPPAAPPPPLAARSPSAASDVAPHAATPLGALLPPSLVAIGPAPDAALSHAPSAAAGARRGIDLGLHGGLRLDAGGGGARGSTCASAEEATSEASAATSAVTSAKSPPPPLPLAVPLPNDGRGASLPDDAAYLAAAARALAACKAAEIRYGNSFNGRTSSAASSA